jgi:hypothetical protein
MSLTLNVVSVLDLADEAVRLRGKEHIQTTCTYLTVEKTPDGLVYKAQCFVGLILFLLVGPQRFITALLPEGSDPYAIREGLNGSCTSGQFDAILKRLDVKVTPEAMRLMALMQKAQDGGLSDYSPRPWGEVLVYAKGFAEVFGLSTDEYNREQAEKEVAALDPTRENMIAWAKSDPEVRRFAEAGQPIQGIKAIRTHFGCGLKEAKDAWDAR